MYIRSNHEGNLKFAHNMQSIFSLMGDSDGLIWVIITVREYTGLLNNVTAYRDIAGFNWSVINRVRRNMFSSHFYRMTCYLEYRETCYLIKNSVSF